MGVGICQWDWGGCNITVTIGEAKSIPLRFPLTGKTALHSFASPLPHGTRCAGLPRGPQGAQPPRSCLLAALRAAGGLFLYVPRGFPSPGPWGYFCRAAKVTKNAPEPMVLDSFLGAACSAANLGGGVKGCAAGFLVRRSLRVGGSSSAGLVLVGLRLSPFQRGTACKGHAV